MDDTLRRGIVTELECIKGFVGLGYQCSVPYGDTARYDVIVDINDKLYKIQCKSSSWSTDTAQEKVAFGFDARTSTTNTKGTKRKLYSENEVDFFYTFFEGKSYLVPFSEMSGKSAFRFRYEYPPTGQKQNIHLERDYLLEKQVQKILDDDKEEVIE